MSSGKKCPGTTLSIYVLGTPDVSVISQRAVTFFLGSGARYVAQAFASARLCNSSPLGFGLPASKTKGFASKLSQVPSGPNGSKVS